MRLQMLTKCQQGGKEKRSGGFARHLMTRQVITVGGETSEGEVRQVFRNCIHDSR